MRQVQITFHTDLLDPGFGFQGHEYIIFGSIEHLKFYLKELYEDDVKKVKEVHSK